MGDASQLLRDGKIDAVAVDALVDATTIAPSLAAATTPATKAALALAAGRVKAQPARASLAGQLGDDGVSGRAAAWALAQLGAEAELLAAVNSDQLDARENGYWGLMVLAARGAASPALAPAVTARVDREIERARSGGTGLGEHACRVLAILGAPGVDALIQRVIENDRYCDRFELQRLRKAVQDGGKDTDSVRELNASYTVLFAEHLYSEPPAKPPPAPASSSPLAGAPSKPGAAPGKPTAKGPTPPTAKPPTAQPPVTRPADEAAFDDQPADAGDEAAVPAGMAATPIDWKAFSASPEAAALAPTSRTLMGQLGPALEQLAVRAVQAPLADLSGQEFAGLLLQVLPQALPPQAVQAALSPQAMNGYQALAKYLARTGIATNGEDLVQGVKLVRRELTEQMRRSGILGGPDYSDPDEPKIT